MYVASLGKAGGVVEQFERESVCVELLELVGAVRVGVVGVIGVELEPSCWDRGDIGVEWAREEGRR